jgi:uncharacterized protein YodC (DUF2158 family)
MEFFKPGDVVRSKSGGPKMTVEKVGIGESHKVKCIWFAGTSSHWGDLRDGEFDPETLKKVD